LSREIECIKSSYRDAIGQVIDKGSYIMGPQLEVFEREFASFCGCGHAVGVASGTDALTLALIACGVKPGDEVITAANTFIATFDTITHCGAIPVPVDPDENFYTITADGIDAAVTGRTSVILPVHLFGQVADLDPILETAVRHSIPVVEDSAQAHGALYGGRKAGSIGKCGCFSFYPSKNLGAFGDGGMVTTNDDDVAAHLRRLRNYGQEKKNVHLEVGYNSRLDTIQAAILSLKLRRLDEMNDLRRDAVSRYREQLEGLGEVVLPPERSSGSKHVYHLFVIRCARRDELAEFLSKRGVSTGIHYPVPPHLQPAYDDLGHAMGSFPVAEKLAGEILSLPMFPHLSNEEVDYVSEKIRDFYGS
jgi:dTDP-4-amino-4,6-dideoxygalactose transaminase